MRSLVDWSSPTPLVWGGEAERLTFEEAVTLETIEAMPVEVAMPAHSPKPPVAELCRRSLGQLPAGAGADVDRTSHPKVDLRGRIADLTPASSYHRRGMPSNFRVLSGSDLPSRREAHPASAARAAC